MNHPSNVVLRHAKCNHFDCLVSHEGGTGGEFQVWRAGLHLVKWQGVDQVYDYLRAMTEFTTIRLDLMRFFNFHIEQILAYTYDEFLQEVSRRLKEPDNTPSMLYEFQRAYVYLHAKNKDWNEHRVMP